MNKPTETITTAEAARRLGVSAARVRAMIVARQILGAKRIGAGNRATWEITVATGQPPRTTNWRLGGR